MKMKLGLLGFCIFYFFNCFICRNAKVREQLSVRYHEHGFSSSGTCFTSSIFSIAKQDFDSEDFSIVRNCR